MLKAMTAPLLGITLAALCAGAAEPKKKEEKAPTVEEVAKLVKDLGDESYAVREAASKALKAMGEPAKPLLQKMLEKEGLDLEVVTRIKAIIAPKPKRTGKTVTDPKTGLTFSIEDGGNTIVAGNQRGRVWMSRRAGMAAESLTLKEGKLFVETSPDENQIVTVTAFDPATGKMLSIRKRKQ